MNAKVGALGLSRFGSVIRFSSVATHVCKVQDVGEICGFEKSF